MTPHGDAIRRLRKSREWGLNALARKAGVDAGYLSRIENGVFRSCSKQWAQRVADALEVPLVVIANSEEGAA